MLSQIHDHKGKESKNSYGIVSHLGHRFISWTCHGDLERLEVVSEPTLDHEPAPGTKSVGSYFKNERRGGRQTYDSFLPYQEHNAVRGKTQT